MPSERKVVLADGGVEGDGHIVAGVAGNADVELHVVAGSGDVVVGLPDVGRVDGAVALFQEGFAMAGVMAKEAVLGAAGCDRSARVVEHGDDEAVGAVIVERVLEGDLVPNHIAAVKLHGTGIDESHLFNGNESEDEGVHFGVPHIDGYVVECLVCKLVGLEREAVDFTGCGDANGVQFVTGVQLLRIGVAVGFGEVDGEVAGAGVADGAGDVAVVVVVAADEGGERGAGGPAAGGLFIADGLDVHVVGVFGGEVLEMVGRLHVGNDRASAGREAGRTVFDIVALRIAAGSPRESGFFFFNIADIQIDGIRAFGTGVVDGEETSGCRIAVHVVERVVVGVADEDAANGIIVSGVPLKMEGVFADFESVGIGVERGQEGNAFDSFFTLINNHIGSIPAAGIIDVVGYLNGDAARFAVADGTVGLDAEDGVLAGAVFMHVGAADGEVAVAASAPAEVEMEVVGVVVAVAEEGVAALAAGAAVGEGHPSVKVGFQHVLPLCNGVL